MICPDFLKIYGNDFELLTGEYEYLCCRQHQYGNLSENVTALSATHLKH